jgi:hypothetical protein
MGRRPGCASPATTGAAFKAGQRLGCTSPPRPGRRALGPHTVRVRPLRVSSFVPTDAVSRQAGRPGETPEPSSRPTLTPKELPAAGDRRTGQAPERGTELSDHVPERIALLSSRFPISDVDIDPAKRPSQASNAATTRSSMATPLSWSPIVDGDALVVEAVRRLSECRCRVPGGRLRPRRQPLAPCQPPPAPSGAGRS